MSENDLRCVSDLLLQTSGPGADLRWVDLSLRCHRKVLQQVGRGWAWSGTAKIRQLVELKNNYKVAEARGNDFIKVHTHAARGKEDTRGLGKKRFIDL